MKKDVLLIAHFCSDFDGTGNNRFNYLAEMYIQNNFDLELITSDFSHNKKMKRDKNIQDDINYKVTFIEEPGYKKNVSVKRFYSHIVMAKNLRRYLELRKIPDLIYCAVPSLDVALVAAKYAQKNNVKFIIDVQDLWPEAFKMVLNIPFVFYPMKKQADFIYSVADEIIAVSDTYKDRALEVNNKVKNANAIYLGTELDTFDKEFEKNKYHNKPDNELWVCYAGTLGHSYDLTSVFDALEIIKRNKNICNVKFIVLGDGPLKKKFEDYAQAKQIDTMFTGRLPYAEMVGILGVCDIAINPIVKGAAQSIINKHGDYAAAGLPVLNTQESLEYRNLVEYYKMGLNCNNNDPQDLAEKLLLLLQDTELRMEMGKNSRRLAEEKFDRKISYQKIMDITKRILE